MTFKDIYTSALNFWIPEIDISDGQSVGNNGGYFPALSKMWDQAEIKAVDEPELIHLMIWAIFCGYHKKAVENFQNEIKKVFLAELDQGYIKNRFEESLFDNGSNDYNEVKKEYIRK
ncbi:hypothetical protein ATO12_15885 [Aquimarina atlantica]|uniref:Uncharacterized protein n=1 Tax=Aquimarina atlantica TaxID=1317122 RepID=A0A023BU01_9FLAO|nr:hypothetical protein [Aquimarina atlantica]EZH73419.1 hypothetical protein ATO12_15885 [Aquimarina atlantica]